MHAPGPLLAAGRDCDIYEYEAGLVLRRARSGRSLAAEAEAMQYLADRGFPVPQIDEISGDGTDLVMERIEGPSAGSMQMQRRRGFVRWSSGRCRIRTSLRRSST